MALINPITGQPLTQQPGVNQDVKAPSIGGNSYTNPFGGTVDTQKNQDIVNQDYGYKKPADTPPTQQNNANVDQPRPVLNGTNASNPYADTAKNYYSGYQMPEEAKIRQQEEERMRLQSQVDSINTLYNQQLAEQKGVYTNLQGQQRALASRGGVLNTPRDQAQQLQLSDKQDKAVQAINAQRNLEISGLYERVDKRVEDKLAAERAFATTNRDKYVAFLKDQQAQSRNDIVTFAQGGGSLADLTTDQYQKLLTDSGMDDFTFKATIATNNPKSKAQFSAVGDKLVGYYVDPKTGDFETFESKSIPGLQGNSKYTIKETANGLVMIPDNIDPNKPIEDQIKIYKEGTDFTAKTGTIDGGFSLSPGEKRYDAKGNLIAEGGEKPAGDKKIVKINGVDYVDNGDGTFSTPEVPDLVPSADKVEKATNLISEIDKILTNPNLGKAIGPKSSQVPDLLRTGERNAVDAAIDSLIANIAIENLSLLKGPMSDKDVQFIKEASSGLKKNVDEASFKAKLTEIKTKFEEIKRKAEQGGSASQVKSREQLKQEFPQASETELDALYKEELGKTSDLGMSKNFAKVASAGSVGGQCGIFSRKLVDFPSGMGNSLTEKKAFVDKIGIAANQWRKSPKVGDVIFTSENPTTGHVAVINAILPDGRLQLSESNYNLDERVSHTRLLDINSPAIYGAVRGTLKA